ncbi:hypothetical protein F5Y04DRAFT_286537 [Hypomontagnella monticulosa]|nr:hypothetical protein F5Y04DRAFT_286537 [Hypomontagnella monticulosa]
MASNSQVQSPLQTCRVLPEKRYVPQDISSPDLNDLVDLALLRVLDAAVPLDIPPPRLFPTAETVLAQYYTPNDWLVHGNLETEMARMSYMLSELPERAIPSVSAATIRAVLSSFPVLESWKRRLPLLKKEIYGETRWIIHQMQSQRPLSISCCQKFELIAIPVSYRTDTTASRYGMQLWTAALSEISLQVSSGHFEHTRTFLEIFAFLKDPLGGLDTVCNKADDLFTHLMSSLRNISRSSTQFSWPAAAAQAAQEALFLACQLLENISYIHFAGHQQLPYTYVSLDQLPRSEFSNPTHVLDIIEEVLVSESEGSCSIAPIAVSSYPAIPTGNGEQMTVIIDGNHRVTATVILRLIAEHPTVLTAEDPYQEAEEFCTNHGLGVKWKVDIVDVLETLQGSQCAALIQRKMDLVQQFRNIQTIPALVVREDNFHTACFQRPPLKDRPRLLLPIHQALYNDETLGFAFPQSGQVHGRALGFKSMPLILSGE